MPINRKHSTSPDLSSLLEGLLEANVNFILVGGLAAVVQGAPITTMDVDIVYDQSTQNINRLFKFLISVSAIYRRPDDKIIEPKAKDFSGKGHALLSTRLGPLDVLAFIEEGKTYDDLFQHTVEIEFRGHVVHVLDLKNLVEIKRFSNDPKARQRLPVLEETLQQLNEKSDDLNK
jgi:hypothetical protein